MADALIMKTGDTDPGFRCRLLDDALPIPPGSTPAQAEEAQAVDLTLASTAKLKIANPDGVLIVNANATIENQVTAKGWVNRAWAGSETAVVDGYRAEVTITWSNGKVRTFPSGNYGDFIIVPKLG